MSAAPKFKNNVKISERHGAGEWLSERVALAALLPLGLWVLSTAFTLTGKSLAEVMVWFSNGLNSALAGITALVFIFFANLAWKTIIEDYVPNLGQRKALLVVANLAFLILAAASIFFIVRLALGSAPLPAGIGA